MEEITTNKDLLLRIQKDDRVAYYKLYTRYAGKLYAFAMKYLKQKQDAEQIVQDVFIAIWLERKHIRIDSSFDAYLFRIAYNKTISHLRKKMSEQKYIEYIKSVQQAYEPVDLMNEIYFRELNNKINFLLDGLTPQQRQIFSMSREEGLTHKEIADKLEISVNTVKKHISNILKVFRSEIGSL